MDSEKKYETVTITNPDGTKDELYVLEETMLNGARYILLAYEPEGDTDVMILKEVADDGEEVTYESIESDDELEAVAGIFGELLDDVVIETEE